MTLTHYLKIGAATQRALTAVPVFFLALACSPEMGSDPVRLVDRFSEATVAGSAAIAEPAPPTEWTFKDGAASGGEWSAGPRTAGVRLTDEGLSGRSVGGYPALELTLPDPAGEGDRLHEIVVRMRSSKGSTLSLTTLGAEGPPTQALAAGESDLTLSVPLIAGPDFQTYRLALDRMFGLGPLNRSAITRLILRPTDEAGAEFTIESVRMTFRKEYLAGIESGIGWHGLSQVWKDAVVTRAPEVATWSVQLPANAWLDVSLGTVSEGPVCFEVGVSAAGAAAEILHRETLTTGEQWRARRIDLSEWEGQRVDLTLTASGSDSALAFWGSPVVRSSLAATGGGSAPPRGVIVILADTLRKHHLELYGHERPNTPTLARMARDGGVVFKDAVSQATWTKVSVPSILSSLYPTTHQVEQFNDRLPSSAVTMAEAFQGAGFATWASSSVPFSGQLTNLHQGVEVLHEAASVELPDGVSSSKTGRHFLDQLAPWLERHSDVPFFAFVHAFDPHSPFEPYPPYDTLWTDEAAAERYKEELELIRPHIKNPLLRRFGMPTRSEMEAAKVDIDRYVEHERAWYDASILGLDTEISRLLETLERLGRAQDTVIAFVSDHGEEFLEHGNHWHGLNVYAEMIEVPLMIYGPGLPGGTEVDTTVQTIDLMPTLLEMAALPIPETLQGESLSSLWAASGPTTRRPPAIAERKVQADTRDVPPEDPFYGSDSLALVDGDWKLIWNTRQGPGVPEYELYHRASDPLDQTNVLAANSDVFERLKAALESWRQLAIAARLPTDAEAMADLSAEDLERLESLGYL